MAYADRLNAPDTGSLPSEFIRPPVLPNTIVTASRNSVGRLDASPPLARRPPCEVRLPCMVYAAVSVLPRHGKADIDAALVEIRRAHGVMNVITYPGLICEKSGIARPEVAVVARGYWLARQALARLMEKCGGPVAAPASNPVQEDVVNLSRVTRGTAQYFDGRLRLWLATSEMEATRALAAQLAGIPALHVDLRVTGEAEDCAPADILTAAIALARQLQPAPVQVIVTPVLAVPLAIVPRGESLPVAADSALAA